MAILEGSVNSAVYAFQMGFYLVKMIQKDGIPEDCVSRKDDSYRVIFQPRNIDLSVYVEKWFDKALLIRNATDVDILIELLNSMDPDTKRELQNYFEEKYFYFRQYSKRLAKVIDQMYDRRKKK